MTKPIPEARSIPANSAHKKSHKVLAKPAHKTRLKAPLKKPLYSPPQHPVGELSLSASFNRVLGRRSLSSKPIPPEPISPEPISPEPISSQMQVLGLNHFNITASPCLIEQVKRFYIDIVGLKIGSRAHLDHEGYWLYAGDSPILHLSARPELKQHPDLKTRPGYFNHISLSCVGLKSAIAKLTTTHTPYRLIELSDIKQTQLFVKDPAGIGVELTFFNECA